MIKQKSCNHKKKPRDLKSKVKPFALFIVTYKYTDINTKDYKINWKWNNTQANIVVFFSMKMKQCNFLKEMDVFEHKSLCENCKFR